MGSEGGQRISRGDNCVICVEICEISRELSLEDNDLTELPKGLEKLTMLTSLYLQNNQLTDVKSLEELTQLNELNLSNNKLTDVKGLEKLTKLKELALSNNPNLPKAQIAELKKALPKCDFK